MKKHKYLFITLLAAFILFNSCNKEKETEVAVTIDIEIDSYNFTVQDTITIEYAVHGNSPDSVCLYENSILVDIQYDIEGIFNFIANNSGAITIKANYYKDGSIVESNSVLININKLKSPELSFKITRIDGEESYFIGEQLLIDIYPRWPINDINDFKKITLFINGDEIGTKTSPPFTFETYPIQYKGNILHAELTDNENRVHLIPHELSVTVNTPPEIDIGISYHMYLEVGIFITGDQIILNYEGNDNVLVEYIDFYVDDQYHSTDSIKSDWFFSETFKLDSLSVGEHNITCVAVDDRNESTTAEPLPIIITQAYKLEEEVMETEVTENNNIIYAISKSKLLVIDPVNEIITNIVELPFPDATSIDYTSENSTLYIAFKDGQIITWNNNSGSFTTISNSVLNNIDDIEIDYSTNTAITISNNNLIALNLSTSVYILKELYLFDGSCLSFDENTKQIIVGGKPLTSGNMFYSCLLHHDSIQIIDYKQLSGFTYRTDIHPNGVDLIAYSKHSNTGLYKYDIADFGNQIGVFSMRNPKSGIISNDGTKFYSGNNLEGEVFVFDYSTCDQIGTYQIPLHDYEYINNIIPVRDMTKLVLTTYTINYSDVRLVFYRF